VKYIRVNSPLNRKVPRLSLYYLQRVMTRPTLRSATITLLRCFVAVRTRQYRNRKTDQGQVLATLRSEGIAALGQILSAEQCREVVHYLSEKPVSARGAATFTVGARPADIAFANHALADLVACPHILALANDPAILELARNYLGCTPTLSGLSARWSFPGESTSEVVQKFHRDSEDWLAFRMMVYLTRVDDASGPHVYVKGSHLDQRTMRLPVLEDHHVWGQFGMQIVRQTGAQGFGFAVDTAGLHKGEVPQDAPRLLLSFQYSILPCFLYEYEPEPVAELIHDPYINRLIVQYRRASSEVEVGAPALDESNLGEQY
jgi:hypothetical protein